MKTVLMTVLMNFQFYKESEVLEPQAGFTVTTGPSPTPVKCSAARGTHLVVGGDETQ